MKSTKYVPFVIIIIVAAATNIQHCLKYTAKCKPSNAKKYRITKLQIRDTNGEMFKVKMFNNVLSTLLNNN